jgi:ankyrin repeat protein
VRELLDVGTNVNEPIHTTSTGCKALQTTSLIQSVYTNQHVAFELLLEYNADPSLADVTKFTPLMCAAKYGRLSMLQTLLKLDPTIDGVDRLDQTAFH